MCNLKDYASKSEAALRYIIQDASEAAICMRGMNATAEAKYLDQVNDACTILHQRRVAQKKA